MAALRIGELRKPVSFWVAIAEELRTTRTVNLSVNKVGISVAWDASKWSAQTRTGVFKVFAPDSKLPRGRVSDRMLVLIR